jgi:dihydrofolate reductase
LGGKQFLVPINRINDRGGECAQTQTAVGPRSRASARIHAAAPIAAATMSTAGQAPIASASRCEATAEGWLMRPRGAYVMGRNMFGPVRGEWDEDWDGWWGSEPPYNAPVFVLTHHARESMEMEGGTSFHFVTQGFEAAYAQARETAGEDGVDIAGGACTVRQALAAGVIDELMLDVVPVLFGAGERLFDGVESFGFEPVEVLHSPLATHIRYRRVG